MTGAGVSTVAAGLALAISGACLAIFFMTDREAWGRANDATIALFAVLMLPAVLDVESNAIATALGVGGLLVVAVTSGLTAAGKLDWLLSAKIGGIGFAGFMAWMIAACISGDLPADLRGFGLATAGLALISLIVVLSFIRTHGHMFEGDAQPPTAVIIGPTLTYLCLVAWTVWLGFEL